MLALPFRGWWVPGRALQAWWASAGQALPPRVPCLVLGRAVGRGPRQWFVVLPASLAFVGGVPVGGGVAVVSSSVRAAALGQAGSFGQAAWAAAWSALGPLPWSVVWPAVPVAFRRRWLASVPGSLAVRSV